MENTEINSILIGVVSSLIASLIFYLAVPFFKSLSKKFLNYYEKKNSTYRNNMVKSAARRDVNHVSDICIIVILIGTLTIVIAMVVGERVDIQSPLLTGTTEKVFTYSISIIFLLVFSFRFLTREKILDRIQSFERKLILIKPGISNEKIDELNYDWTKMQTDEDYKKIEEIIISILKQKKEGKHDD